eukprot:2026178-Ditylum_brightwellii.AAC.1
MEQYNKDNTDADMNLVHDNDNNDDENGKNSKMDEQKNEEGCKDTLSAAALKLSPPSPVEDTMEDLLAATSSYHNNNNNDETPGFQLHTEEEVEDTVMAPPVGVNALMTAVNQAGYVVRNLNRNVSGLAYKF